MFIQSFDYVHRKRNTFTHFAEYTTKLRERSVDKVTLIFYNFFSIMFISFELNRLRKKNKIKTKKTNSSHSSSTQTRSKAVKLLFINE